KHPAQAAVIDVMLKVKKGIFLSELLELTLGSRSPVDALVKKGALTLDLMRIDRSPLVNEEYFRTKPKILNSEQHEAVTKIVSSLQENRFETHLLHGVTGSGKTEVYLQSIEKALHSDKSSIILVPEISLTAQTIERFRSRFEGHIAILHHRLSHGERFDEWHKIKRGEAKIVIGARSAVFSPVKNLGLLIVDEEHEHSYKQSEEAPCYNARDVAVMRGKLANATIILGSATPSLESYYNAQSGKYTLSNLQIRADAASMPTVQIADMKIEWQKAKSMTSFSDNLLKGIKQRQAVGEQTILFLNRRGYHTSLLCPTCGTAVRCHQCDVTMTFHKGHNHLCCHLCSYQISPPPTCCPGCKADVPMKFRGIGTELIEKALLAILPDLRTLRIDADTTRHKGSHQKLLRDFGSGKADVLIGTQMIAKGLHFPQVTLVGVLNSDTSLSLPDFRASETTFQLITQVSGRAGRGSLAGEVIIQTCMPDNNIIQHASKQDFHSFYREEIAIREMFAYPPFTQMAKVTFSGEDEKKVLEVAEYLRHQLILRLPGEYPVNPVVPAGHAKIKNKFRFQFLIRGKNSYTISKALESIQQAIKLPGTIKMSIDINPTSTYF
ncbi:MAG: primosomal protein N', partial [Parachlamydiaceae bacterium]|nr:primosomal protein N' [Parachlamydiaceae bacterium]